jgi:hypothetical protein
MEGRIIQLVVSIIYGLFPIVDFFYGRNFHPNALTGSMVTELACP